jgi:uncharacterized protein (DUF1919 family)
MFRFIYKIKHSIAFRYKHWLKQKQAKRLACDMALHQKKMKSITAKDFTIISANCWGGSVYEDLELPYQTPTVGLFFYAPCFMELLKDLKTTISLPLTFHEASKYEDANVFRNESYRYAIGKLGTDIEIHFLHYKTEEEAKDKWERRKQRINWDNLFIACTDRDGMSPELMTAFDDLPYKRKVIFAKQPYATIKSAHYLKAFKKDKLVGDLYNQRNGVSQNFNIKEWLSNNA